MKLMHPLTTSEPAAVRHSKSSFGCKTGWLRESKHYHVVDPVEIDSGAVEQKHTAAGMARQQLLDKHGMAFNLHGQHQCSATPDMDANCEVCKVPEYVSKAQLDFMLDIYEEQLHAYDGQRKAIVEAYKNGGTIANVLPPPQKFSQVNGVRNVASGYLSKYESYGGTFRTFFPEDIRDVFARMSREDVEVLLSAWDTRVDHVGDALDKARLDHTDSTAAFRTLMGDLASISKSTANADDLQLSLGTLIDVNVEEVTKLFAAAKVHGVPAEEWTKAVPKDFSLYMGIPHAEHLKCTASVQADIDAHRSIGHPSASSKRKRFQQGFDPVQLSRKHALNCGPNFPKDRTSTLRMEIHPIFARKNFDNCPADVYEVLKPALRLASAIILHQATSLYWHTAAFGRREVCSLNALNGQHSVRIRDDVPWSESNAQKFEKDMNDIANHVHFYFNAVQPDTEIYGMCWIPCEHRRFVLPLDNVWVRYAKIHLAFDFYTTALRISKTENPDPDMVLRFNFLFAATFTHEFAHFLESAHQPDATLGEPYFNDNSYAENDFAFEAKTFGGRISAINDRTDCAYGLCIADCSFRDELHHEPDTYYSIPMEYIVMIQQQEIWDDPSILAEPDFFHVPKTGARSCGTSTLSMQVWEDESQQRAVDIVDIDAGWFQNSPDFTRTTSGRVIKSNTLKRSKEDNKVIDSVKKPQYEAPTTNEKYNAVAKKQADDVAALRLSRVANGRVKKNERTHYVQNLKDSNCRHREAAKKRNKKNKSALKEAAAAIADYMTIGLRHG